LISVIEECAINPLGDSFRLTLAISASRRIVSRPARGPEKDKPLVALKNRITAVSDVPATLHRQAVGQNNER